MTDNNDWEKRLIESLRKRADPADPDRATLAELRRYLGGDLGRALFHVGWLFNGVPDRFLENAALVAALFATNTMHLPGVSLGQAFRRLRERLGGDSTEKRFVALLDSNRDDLPGRLRQAVALLKSREIGLDWELLLRDLRYWGSTSHRVQRRWARDFWAEERAEAPASATTAEKPAPEGKE
jgi:CRISPR type I-E-associated protein CasB/Cse2